jgi:hypothetical protein
VTFTPSAEGQRTGNITIQSNALIGTQQVPLSGIGD